MDCQHIEATAQGLRFGQAQSRGLQQRPVLPKRSFSAFLRDEHVQVAAGNAAMLG
jgi:hypothetical protein